MTDDDVSLKQFDLVGTDDLVLKRPETGRDTVCDLTPLDQCIDGLGTAFNLCSGALRKRHNRLTRPAVRDRKHLFKRKALAVDDYLVHLVREDVAANNNGLGGHFAESIR